MSTLNLEQELKAKKINPTAMRLLVLKFLKQQKGAVSLADIEASFEQSDRVTLYRTVKTFESKGLLHSITTNNITHYALCAQGCDEKNHHDTHL
ncbi:transcriptional repressor, partial [Escherichia coli]